MNPSVAIVVTSYSYRIRSLVMQLIYRTRQADREVAIGSGAVHLNRRER